MKPKLNNQDWEEVFKYATPTVCKAGHTHGPSQVLGDNVSIAPFTREDVDEIIAMSDGENDGESWIGVFKLKDERYAYIEGSCDYTGWG